MRTKILACLIWIFCLSTFDATKLVAQEANDSEHLKRNVYSNFIEIEAQDFVRLNRPKPGEWLHQFPESGQSLEQYKAKDSKALLNSRRRMIVLQPLGKFSDEQRLLFAQWIADALNVADASLPKPRPHPWLAGNDGA